MEKIPEDAGISASGAQPGPEALPDRAVDESSDQASTSRDGTPIELSPDELMEQERAALDTPRRHRSEQPTPQSVEAVRFPERPTSKRPEQINVESPELFRPAPESSVSLDDLHLEHRGTGENSLRQRISQAALEAERDPFSTSETSPDPDDGAGARTLAHAFISRVKALQDAGKLPADTPLKACEVDTGTGLGTRRFMDTLMELDEEIYRRTEMTVTCTNNIRLEAMRESGMFDGHPNVELRGAVRKDPKTQVTDGALAVLFDQTLNRMPGNHRLYWDKEPVDRGISPVPVLREVSEASVMQDPDTPLVTIDEEYNPKLIFPSNLGTESFIGAAESTQEMLPLSPQLTGRVVTDPRTVDLAQNSLEKAALQVQEQVNLGQLTEGQAKDILGPVYNEYLGASPYRSLGAELGRQEDDVKEFMDKQPPGHSVVYTQGATELVETAVSKSHPDAIILIAGPQRLQADHWISLDKLIQQQGVLTTHVTDGTHIRLGVEKSMPTARISIEQQAPGSYGYAFIDKTPEDEMQISAELQLEQTSTRRTDLGRLIGEVHTKLQLAGSKSPEELKKTLAYLEQRFDIRSKESSVVQGSYAVAIELAKIYNAYGTRHNLTEFFETAARHAKRAADILPYASDPHIQVAKASIRLGNSRQAQQALALAKKASPHNAAIYLSGIHHARTNPDHKQRLQVYIENLANYIRYAPNLDTKTTVDSIIKLCEAREAAWKAGEKNNGHFKTVVAWNTETDNMVVRSIDEATIRQAQAAEAYLRAWDAVQSLLNTRAYETGSNQERDRIVSSIVEGYRRTCFYDDEGEPLPPDSWPNRPSADSPEILIYEGTINQSDQEVPPNQALEFYKSYMIPGDGDKVAENPDDRAEVIYVDDFKAGDVVDADGRPTGSSYNVTADMLGIHVVMLGTSGSGKTECLKYTSEEIAKMGINVVRINFGKAGEFDDMPARMEGIAPVRVIKMGKDDISLNVYQPDGRLGDTEPKMVRETIGRICRMWEKAFDMPPPFDKIFKNSLFYLYADCGWDVGDSKYPVAAVNPRIPTLEEHLEYAVKETEAHYADKHGSSEAKRTAVGFFTQRFTSLINGPGKIALATGKPFSPQDIVKGNFEIDLGDLTDPDDRRLIGLGMMDIIIETIEANRRPTGGRLETLIVMEEAHIALGTSSASPSQGANMAGSRQQHLKTLAEQVRQLRAYRTSFFVVSQTPDILPDFLSNAALQLSFQLTAPGDRRTVSGNFTANDSLAKVTLEQLHTLPRGRALIWQRGEPTATQIRTPYDPTKVPSDEAREAALKRQPPLPILRQIDRDEVDAAAKSPDNLEVKTVINAVTLSHVAGIRLPKIPEAAQDWWEKTKATKGTEFAEQVLGRMVGDIVGERVKAINEHHPPRVIGHSTYKLTKALLEGMPTGSNRYTSAYSLMPQIAWLEAVRDSGRPLLRPEPQLDNYARPPQHQVPGLKYKPGERIPERLDRLRRLGISPLQNSNNADIAFRAIAGGDVGDPTMMDTFRGITPHLPLKDEVLPRRRTIAEMLGHSTMNGPSVDDSGIEAALALLGLYDTVRDTLTNLPN